MTNSYRHRPLHRSLALIAVPPSLRAPCCSRRRPPLPTTSPWGGSGNVDVMPNLFYASFGGADLPAYPTGYQGS